LTSTCEHGAHSVAKTLTSEIPGWRCLQLKVLLMDVNGNGTKVTLC
jgi:hypothetical protein